MILLRSFLRPGLRGLALFRSALRAPVICSPSSCVGQESRLLPPASRFAQTSYGFFQVASLPQVNGSLRIVLRSGRIRFALRRLRSNQIQPPLRNSLRSLRLSGRLATVGTARSASFRRFFDFRKLHPKNLLQSALRPGLCRLAWFRSALFSAGISARSTSSALLCAPGSPVQNVTPVAVQRK